MVNFLGLVWKNLKIKSNQVFRIFFFFGIKLDILVCNGSKQKIIDSIDFIEKINQNQTKPN